jgi:hypothetical protein
MLGNDAQGDVRDDIEQKHADFVNRHAAVV